MPIYEYICESCDHLMEVMQKIKDKALQVCPICEEKSLKRLIGKTSFVLKGTGWYETDYKKNKETTSD